MKLLVENIGRNKNNGLFPPSAKKNELLVDPLVG